MHSFDIFPAVDDYTSLISKSISTRNLKLATVLHSHLIKTGLTLQTFISNGLIGMYSKFHAIDSANKAFHDLPIKNTRSWNTLISVCCHDGILGKARELFDQMPEPNIVTYNTMLSGLNRNGHHKESLHLFRRMQLGHGCLFMDEFTLVSISGACACLGALEFLRQLHGAAIVIGLQFSRIVYNALVDSYGKCGDPNSSFCIFSQIHERDVVSWTSMVVAYARSARLDDAIRLFNEMPTKNSVSWTALIASFAQNGHGEKALDLLLQMQKERIQASAFTYVSALGACADLALIQKGKQIHGNIIRSGNKDDIFNVFILNALVDMYCKSGDMKSAKAIFEIMPNKDMVSWNSLITGFAQNGSGEESLEAFRKMIESNIKPNHVTFLGVLSAFNHSGSVCEELSIMDLMEKYGVTPRADHYAILIDLLGRKNRIREAMDVIKRVPDGLKHARMWGAILSASQVHGNFEIAKIAAEALLELEPGNAARYIALSNIYAAANQWDDAHNVRGVMLERGLIKETAFSWIDVRNTRHEFVAKRKVDGHLDEVYETTDKLLDHMKDSGYIPTSSSYFS